MPIKGLNKKPATASVKPVKRAKLPKFESVDDLPAFGKKLFKLAEKVPPDQLLDEEEIEREIARRRGGMINLGE
jgi:hypothetical protein